MEIETLEKIQAYGYYVLLFIMVFMLYGYIYHLYKSEKTGTRDYEKYANLALKDELDDELVESILDTKNKEQ